MSKTHPIPPRLATRFLTWLIRDDLAEEVLGDLEEKFYATLETQSPFRARLNYWYQILNYLRPFALKKSKHSNHTIMLSYHFRIAWRTLVKQKMFSAIKIGGFSLGIAACLLITLFIKDELSYDRHYPDKERIYRVLIEINFRGTHAFVTHFQAPYAQALKDELPEIQKAGRINSSAIFGAGNKEVRRIDRDRSNHEDQVVYFDQELLEIFSPDMIEGSLTDALASPNTIVLSQSKANSYFPEGNAVGKTLVLNEDIESPFRVGGVMEDFPANSHLDLDFLVTMTGREFYPGEQKNWISTSYFTYVQLVPHANVAALESKLDQYMAKYWIPVFEDLNVEGANEDTVRRIGQHILQPITDIHLKSGHIDDGMVHGDVQVVWLFGCIAGFILILACINFVNLSTAKSASRAKEVGLRRALGSQRNNLIQQFLVESVLVSLIAFLLGALLAFCLLPFFNELSGKSLTIPWLEGWFVAAILLVTILVGLLSGLYPSFYLSAFGPVEVLKGSLSNGSKNPLLRNALVVFQFATSIGLIVGTLVIYMQMDFVLNKNLGFKKDQVILLKGAQTMGEKLRSFKNELLQLSDVESVSASDYLPIEGHDVKRDGNNFWVDGRGLDQIPVNGQYWKVDQDYISTMGMKILEGRDFADDPQNNRRKVIINETMAQKLGLKQPLGRSIKRDLNGEKTLEIIGVVEDFHFQSFKHEINPLCLRIGEGTSVLSVKARMNDLPALLSSISRVWDEFSPKQPLRYEFLDDRFSEMYEGVRRTGKVLGAFTILAVAVACLGLFGLSAFIIEQRSKEISIRKILGASVQTIFNLLTFSFLKLVLISLFIAIPVSWILMKKWLEDFVYRVDLAWWFFVLAGVLAIVIALLTISRQALKVSFANPANHLRSE